MFVDHSMISSPYSSTLFIFLIVLTSLSLSVLSSKLQIQYYRKNIQKPEEYGHFRIEDGDGNTWETYVYMNKTVNLREEQIEKIVKPFYDGQPNTATYQSASITRHLGKQLQIVLDKFLIDEVVFENLCTQMKPKFSLIFMSTNQKPSKVKFIVEHPSASFAIPDGFRRMGLDEYQLIIGGRALLSPLNLEFDGPRNTRKLIVKQGKEYKNGLSNEQILKLKAEELYIEGPNVIDIETIKQLGKEWENNQRNINKWELHLSDELYLDDTKMLFRRSGGQSLNIELTKEKLIMNTN